MDDNGGRITLALVVQRLDSMDKKLDKIIEDQCKQNDAIHALEVGAATANERIKTVEQTAVEAKDKADKASNLANWWNSTNTLLALVAGALGLKP